MRSERGVATVEWTALVLVVSLGLGALVTVGPRVDGRSLGAEIAHRIACAARGGCAGEDDELAAAYGARDAALVRAHAPSIRYERGTLTLPVDWRRCRSHRCSDAPDDPSLDVHRSSRGGHPATAFTRVVRDGDETFIQYWLYYPDSTSTVMGAAGAWNRARAIARRAGVRAPAYPGWHRDDWESYQVRIDGRGRVSARASSHRAYQACRRLRCRNEWTTATGWTRVSYGSHAGHIPLRAKLAGARLVRAPKRSWPARPFMRPGPGRERTTSSAGLRLVPLERIDRRSYRPLDDSIVPPWRKRVYHDPRSDSTS